MSSSNPTESPLVIATLNGSIQLSRDGTSVGLLVERAGLCTGTLLSHAQAHELARLMLDGSRLNEAVDT
jgi:hypothetical protein